MPGKTQEVPECLLDAYEVHVIATYHMDGMSYGPVAGTEDKVAQHVDFLIHEGEPGGL